MTKNNPYIFNSVRIYMVCSIVFLTESLHTFDDRRDASMQVHWNVVTYIFTHILGWFIWFMWVICTAIQVKKSLRIWSRANLSSLLCEYHDEFSSLSSETAIFVAQNKSMFIELVWEVSYLLKRDQFHAGTTIFDTILVFGGPIICFWTKNWK